jgi:hypothetical protein
MTASDGVFRVPNAIGGEDPTPGPSKGGRPPHAASDENRRQVKVMAARLMPQEAIAAIIGIESMQTCGVWTGSGRIPAHGGGWGQCRSWCGG